MSLLQVSTVHDRVRRDGAAGPTANSLRDHWSVNISEFMRHIEVNRVVVAVLHVASRRKDWDGYGSPPANERAVTRAVEKASEYVAQTIASDLDWEVPHVGSNELGEVSFEWWNGAKKLTIYIGSDVMHFVSSWGLHIEEEMEAGPLDEGGFLKQWRWFQQRDNL